MRPQGPVQPRRAIVWSEVLSRRWRNGRVSSERPLSHKMDDQAPYSIAISPPHSRPLTAICPSLLLTRPSDRKERLVQAVVRGTPYRQYDTLDGATVRPAAVSGPTGLPAVL